MGVFSQALKVTLDGCDPEVVTIDQRDMMAACQSWPMPNEAQNTLERVGWLRAAAGNWFKRHRGMPVAEFEAVCAEVTPAGDEDDPDPDPTLPATSDG